MDTSEKRKILKLYRQGVTYKDIATATGYSSDTINKTIQKYTKKGTLQRRQARITSEQARNIKQMHTAGNSIKAIADKLNISYYTANRAIKRADIDKARAMLMELEILRQECNRLREQNTKLRGYVEQFIGKNLF